MGDDRDRKKYSRGVPRDRDRRRRSRSPRDRDRSPSPISRRSRSPHDRDRVRERDRDRDRIYRERRSSREREYRYADRDRDRERDKDRHREKERYRELKERMDDKPSSSKSKHQDSNDTGKEVSGVEEGTDDKDESAMMALMGFGGFDSTKGKHVNGNDVYCAAIHKKRKYRQYMNRRGGFNRPLDPIT